MHYRRIPTFVAAHYLVRRLDEFAEYLSKNVGRLAAPVHGFFTIGDLLRLLEPPYAAERDGYFEMRLAGLVEDTAGETPSNRSRGEARHGDGPQRLRDVHRDDRRATRSVPPQVRHRVSRFHVQAERSRGHAPVEGSARRFVLDSRLLEVLLQIAVLRTSADGFHTGELRVDELLVFLRERYGIFIDQLPRGDGFATTSIEDQRALRDNVRAFTGRLREVGFYRDLSDAYVTQTITPRYTITATNGGSR